MIGKKLPRYVPKPWGSESIFADTSRCAGKIIRIEATKRISLQYHKEKEETILVLEGEVLAQIGDNTEILTPGDIVEIPPTTIHRFKALIDTKILEVSTPELDDVVRLEDDYGRESKDG